ncbi:DUF3626 domain-containing protein [Billgrantia endophytica]|uniref:DUF3626 domain-containing protein n=1 Tax=Billgrantia endophytica TaxID=2033802 RepID=A0A2N7U7Q6_9GAMM|nr:DUF3626 domain-containing protein [Halomonas endophytica]PMR76470.1 DUF3626 domain-containing protein [Halomonas endophytica]
MEKDLSIAQHKVIEHFRHLCLDTHEVRELDITINFHPDRLTRSGMLILDAIGSDGVLKSQFETNTSNGGLTAFEGGDRWRWESQVFQGFYDSASSSERPKYGTLNHRSWLSGGSPRFGSSYFRLNGNVLDRTTFCYPESWLRPKEFGYARKVKNLIDLADRDNLDKLDSYIEAHIHGSIVLERDVAALILDPCFKGTEIERAASRLPCQTGWHHGFKLAVSVIERNKAYRGPQYARIAQTIAVDGEVDPALIGHAVNEQLHDPQDLKKVWHYLARFGDLNEKIQND